MNGPASVVLKEVSQMLAKMVFERRQNTFMMPRQKH
jgi:hypothetical protein